MPCNYISNKSLINDIQVGHFPADINCVTGAFLGESQLVMLHYYTNLIIHGNHSEPEDCRYKVFQYRKNMEEFEVPEIFGWKMVWKGRRPNDKKEFYALYRRSLNKINISS